MNKRPLSKSAFRAIGGVVGSTLKSLTLVVAASVLLAGCARYDVRLTKGTQFNNVRKPVYNEKDNTYTIKSASGQTFKVNKSQIQTIEPHESMKQRMHDGSMFLN